MMNSDKKIRVKISVFICVTKKGVLGSLGEFWGKKGFLTKMLQCGVIFRAFLRIRVQRNGREND